MLVGGLGSGPPGPPLNPALTEDETLMTVFKEQEAETGTCRAEGRSCGQLD